MDKSHSDRYNRILERYEKEVSELQTRISTLELSKRGNIEPKLSYAIMLINNIDSYIRDAPLETKIKLIGSIFDDKIEYDGEKYRTNSYNKVLDLILDQRIFQVGNPIIYQAYCVPLLYESRTVTPCHPPGCAYR